MNIFDYLKWRGDLSFKKDPFNEVDNLILSYISYTNFDGILENKAINIKEASDLFFKKISEKEANKSKSFVASAPFILKEAAKTNRFKDCVLHNYVNSISEERCFQFSALEFDLNDNTTYIAFRGTDDTLVGWMEDLELAYKIVPAQKLALEYLTNNTKPLRKYRVGGHSKGGALALYASYSADLKIQSRIISIYNNDGPGINDSLFNQDKFNLIKDKYLDIFPEQSVFGQIFYNKANTVIVPSSQLSLYQHDGTSWEVLGNKFVNIKLSNSSKYIREELNNFFNKTTLLQREKLVNAINKAIENTNFKTVQDLSGNGLTSLIKFTKSILEEDEETKELGNLLINVLSSTINKTISKAKDDLKKEAESAIKKHLGK